MSKRGFWVSCPVEAAVRTCINDIHKYDEKVQTALRVAVRGATQDIWRGAKGRINSLTGNLAKGLNTEFNASACVGYVRSTAPHSHLVEFGASGSFEVPTVKRALFGRGYEHPVSSAVYIPERKPHPFLQPAVDDNAPKFESDVRKAVEKP